MSAIPAPPPPPCSCPEGGFCADPFAGSGQTLIACANTGRRAVGWELNDEYARRAATALRGSRSAARRAALTAGVLKFGADADPAQLAMEMP